MTDAYTRSVEKANEKLQQELDEARKIADRYTINPLESALTLLIDECLKQQKRLSLQNAITHENVILRIDLPRQIGLSTSILRSASKFFTDIHIIHTTPFWRANKPVIDGVTVYNHGCSSRNLDGYRLNCVIVDPWKHRYGGADYAVWTPQQTQILSRFDVSKPCLLILAG
jgi:hypothetical protein